MEWLEPWWSCQLVIRVAWAGKGEKPYEIRHRDDPKGFWKRIRRQIMFVYLFSFVLAVMATFA